MSMDGQNDGEQYSNAKNALAKVVAARLRICPISPSM
jgi:hypothetical protein